MGEQPLITPHEALADLQRGYADHGHSMWFVGGCVRDALRGETPSDYDLATTATPEQQVSICETLGIRWIGTGLAHGTITAIAGGAPYEITTLRRDVETDGRHAVVEWTPDIAEDLGRRDLTINAMAMTFEGELIDPFGGLYDLRRSRVRFVGDADERIREDHLRILRWFRFHARYGTTKTIWRPDLQAISRNAALLSTISIERVWSEIKKILTGPATSNTLSLMEDTGTLAAIGLRNGDSGRLIAAKRETTDAGALFAAWQGAGGAGVFVDGGWRISNAERDSARFAAARAEGVYDLRRAKTDLVDGHRIDLIRSMLAIRNDVDAMAEVTSWKPVPFPVTGKHLAQAGIRPGRGMGDVLRELRRRWIESDFSMDADTLIEMTKATDQR